MLENTRGVAVTADEVEVPQSSGRQSIYVPPRERVAQSQMTEFARLLQPFTGRMFPSYNALHRFCADEFRTFWEQFLSWSKIEYDGETEPVCLGDVCESAVFFPNLRLNYAENLLASPANSDAPAVIACHSGGRRERLTRGELRDKVMSLAQALEARGIMPGDRVVAILRNNADAVVAALAVAAVGAALSVAAPEMGADAILARFIPLTPKLLIAHTAAQAHDTGQPLALRIAEVAARLPSLAAVATIDGDLTSPLPQPIFRLPELISQGNGHRFQWKRFPFNHPLFIVFSSGTTGPPKCIIHGTGGTLLEHVKEHRLHCDLRQDDRMFFHTSCAWMMWNWQLSALATGTELVLYDGPIDFPETLWDIVAEERTTVFGTSAAYLKMCEDAGAAPGRDHDLSALHSVLSTGSILYDQQYYWLRDNVKDLPLQSISGGTDILGCFVLGNPNLPVYAGESQCRSLGLDVQALPTEWAGESAENRVGELICANPFPSRPLGFFGDEAGKQFHEAYFARNAGVWTHGDLIEFTEEGTARLHGRSDGVLNVHGNRIGPAEVYRILQDFSQIQEALAVERQGGTDLRQNQMVLLLVLHRGEKLDGELTGRIRRELARRASRAHVPNMILSVTELPTTHSGKRSEAAARDAVNGIAVRNAAALRNPPCLEEIRAAVAAQSHPSLDFSADIGDSTLECLLTREWEALFGFSPIGPADDFFELGGQSLYAANLVARIRALTGRDLPIATLLGAPTIERLAQVIRAKECVSSPLLLLRQGAREQPLFFVHSVAGTVLETWALVRTMECHRAIYGIQARGLQEGETPLSSVENMAEDYIGQIRSIQPRGPYALAGFSFGGLIAFEMARRLLQSGDQIELVGLVDTEVDGQWLPFRAWLAHQRRHVALEISEIRARSARQVATYISWRLSKLADRIRLRTGRRPKHSYLDEQALGELAAPLYMRRVRDGLRVAMTAYCPKSYPGKVTLFRATIRNPRLGDPLGIWKLVSQGGLEVIEIPGAHNYLMAQPSVVCLARELDRVLGGNRQDRGQNGRANAGLEKALPHSVSRRRVSSLSKQKSL